MSISVFVKKLKLPIGMRKGVICGSLSAQFRIIVSKEGREGKMGTGVSMCKASTESNF